MSKTTRRQREKARQRLRDRYWGNARMTGEEKFTTTFTVYQQARLDAWESGMKVGFAAGLRLAATTSEKS